MFTMGDYYGICSSTMATYGNYGDFSWGTMGIHHVFVGYFDLALQMQLPAARCALTMPRSASEGIRLRRWVKSELWMRAKF